MAPKLPKPIAEYLAAVEEKNSNKLAGCFAENAVVHDEGGTYGGHDAIKAWSEETQGKYNYTMMPWMPRLPETVSASALK